MGETNANYMGQVVYIYCRKILRQPAKMIVRHVVLRLKVNIDLIVLVCRKVTPLCECHRLHHYLLAFPHPEPEHASNLIVLPLNLVIFPTPHQFIYPPSPKLIKPPVLKTTILYGTTLPLLVS